MSDETMEEQLDTFLDCNFTVNDILFTENRRNLVTRGTVCSKNQSAKAEKFHVFSLEAATLTQIQLYKC